MTAPRKTDTGYIRGFDGLRAILTVMVLAQHLGSVSWITNVDLGSVSWFTNAQLLHYYQTYLSGGVALTVFFVISGFLITRILIGQKKRKGISLKKFYIRRFMRLSPPLVIFFLLVFVLMLTHSIKDSYAGLLFSMFYLYNYIPHNFFVTELSHTWSLALEEQYYLLWPIVLSTLAFRKVLLFIGVLVALSLLSAAIYPYLYIPYNDKEYLLRQTFNMSRWFIPAALPVMIGSLSALLHDRSDTSQRRWLKSGLILLPALLFYALPGFGKWSGPGILFSQSIGIALFLIWIIENQYARFVNALEFAPMAYVGRMSYSIYIFQGIFLRTGPGGPMWFHDFPINVLLTAGLAMLSYHFVEQPVLKLRDRFT